MLDSINTPAETTGESTLGRNLLLGAGAAAVATAVLGSRAAHAQSRTLTFSQIAGTGDIKVLNYALALETLEAELYRQALARLTTGGDDNLGGIIPGLGIASTQPDVQYVRTFGTVEAQHRDFLDGALGTASALRLPLAQGGLQGVRFNFRINTLSRQDLLRVLYTVENLGTQAYLGAIPFFATKTYLLQAGAIQATEARHTAVIAATYNALFGATFETAPLSVEQTSINGTAVRAGIDGTVTPDQALAAAAPFLVLP